MFELVTSVGQCESVRVKGYKRICPSIYWLIGPSIHPSVGKSVWLLAASFLVVKERLSECWLSIRLSVCPSVRPLVDWSATNHFSMPCIQLFFSVSVHLSKLGGK